MNTTLFFPAAVWIDNVALTDQGRSPVNVGRDERSVVVELATGKRKKYIKAIKHTFEMSWTYLPDHDEDTIDGGVARATMVSMLRDSGDTHVLRFYDRNSGWDDYTVFVSDYAETLMRRDPSSGRHFWQVNLSFEEQ